MTARGSITARAIPRLWRFAVSDKSFSFGLVTLAAVVLVAMLGPVFSPHDMAETLGPPGLSPVNGAPLGLDYLGRDVLSRVLDGGRSTLLLGLSATVLIYAVGLLVGLTAGYARTFVDPVLMRTVDLLLSFPALLLMLLFVTAFGSGATTLVLAAVVVLFPGVARIVRTATMTVMSRGYVEAAIARGESPQAIVRREVLPNIVGPIAADAGVRFGWSIILIASVNYLGLGLRPPSSDWGLMISENRAIVAENPLALLVPAMLIALLVVAVNMVGDGFARMLGRSENR